MNYLLERQYVGPNTTVALLGDPYTGALVIQVNELQHRLDRDSLRLLAEQVATFLERTAECPRCGHSRLDHFRLFTQAGYLFGCSHGTGERWPLAEGLSCDCPGVPQ